MRSLLRVIHVVFLVPLIVWLMTVAAQACAVCVAYPQKSAADYLIGSRCVILAREDPERPFCVAPVEVLKGKVDGEPIDFFLDSTSRRILASDDAQVLVIVQEGTKEKARWRSLGRANVEYATIVRRILSLAPGWRGPRGASRRIDFFLPLFGHENRLIYELAYLELARAPYDTIRRMGRAAPRETIERILRRPEYIEWRSLAILMLAQSERPKDKRHIRESFRTAIRFGLIRNLAAWTAASIEVDGAASIAVIENNFFRQADCKPQELRAVLSALSLHGTEGRKLLRDHIVASYSALLDFHPAMGGYVADDLLKWKRFELSDKLSLIGATEGTVDPAARKSIRRYLSLRDDLHQLEASHD